MADVAMPRLSDSMEEGTILKWLKSDGDEVKRGEELVEIETDKANMTYEADQDGVLKIVAAEGDTLPVGETIASIGDGTAAAAAGDDDAETGDAEPAAAGEESAEAEQSGGEEESAAEEDAPRRAAEPADDGPQRAAGPAAAESRASGDDGSGNGRIKASPVARRMARELGLELARLEGTGPGGRITKADVEAAAGGPGAPAGGGGGAAVAEPP